MGTLLRRIRWWLAAVALAEAPATASPDVPLDDPVDGSRPDGWWLSPVERAALRLEAVSETARGYSTTERPRNVAGVLALSCEGQEGRPCGQGIALSGEVDTAAGFGRWVSGAVRLRVEAGTNRYASEVAVDRGHVNAELGPIAAEIGRDVLVVGPPSPTVVGWGTNAPPLDHLRLSARSLALAEGVRANLVYVLGRLSGPQTYPGDLVSIARAQLDLGERFEVGATQLLQLGGDGAPGFGVIDFVLEHVRRRDPSASASDSSNRRFGIDVATRIDGFGGARIGYQLMFEDLRKRVVDAIRYDADHVLDVETRWLTVEWRKTGVRAYEHTPRLTGFTSGGRIVGDPLGPDAQAVQVSGRIDARWGAVIPWAEVAALSSDTYTFIDHGPILPTGRGPSELRFRLGARARVQVGEHLELDPEAAVEDVERASFVPGARRGNAMFRLLLVWRPAARSATVGAR